MKQLSDLEICITSVYIQTDVINAEIRNKLNTDLERVTLYKLNTFLQPNLHWMDSHC